MLLDTEPDVMSMYIFLCTKYFLPSVIILDKSVSRKERKINRHLKDRRSRKSLSGSASDTWHTCGGDGLDLLRVFAVFADHLLHNEQPDDADAVDGEDKHEDGEEENISEQDSNPGVHFSEGSSPENGHTLNKCRNILDARRRVLLLPAPDWS